MPDAHPLRAAVIAGWLMLPDDRAGVRLTPGWLRVAGATITEVNAGPCPHTPDLGGDDALILPGFIDAHVHLPQFDRIGIDGLHLLDWLSQAIFPAEARWQDAAYAASRAESAIRQLLSFGTTGFLCFATSHAPSTQAAIEIARSLGVRAGVGHVLMDREAPPQLCIPATRALPELAALLAAAPPGGRVACCVAPRFAITCTPALLAGAAELARQHDALIHTHLAETPAECARVAELYAGQSDYTSVYAHAGLLTPRSVFAHGIYLSERECAELRTVGATIAHCPVANTFLQSGRMPLRLWLDSGMKIALGSDIGGGHERSMVRVARAMIETAKHRGDVPPTPAAAWYQITAGNADALNWPAGRLASGLAADLLIARPDIPWRDSPDPLGTLLYAWDDRWLESVITHGRMGYAR